MISRQSQTLKKWAKHIQFFYGPLATAVGCRHCEWSAHERKDGTGFAQRSRLMKLGVAHVRSAHQRECT